MSRYVPTLRPVLMFDQSTMTPSDTAALAAVHSLMDDVYETQFTERSKQKRIGISEIGDPCDRCVARKLSGLYDDMPDSFSWKAQVGTFIHAGLEEQFVGKYQTTGQILNADNEYDYGVEFEEQPSDLRPFYASERHVKIWEYKGHYIGGSCDLFVQGASFGLVDDWKTQNTKKLSTKTAKGQIGQTYTVQMHTYGLGYELLGFNVTHVVLYALPRDGELADAKPVLMRYDKQIALDALGRLKNFIDMAEIIGWPTVIETRQRESFCFGCNDYEAAENQGVNDFLGLNK